MKPETRKVKLPWAIGTVSILGVLGLVLGRSSLLAAAMSLVGFGRTPHFWLEFLGGLVAAAVTLGAVHRYKKHHMPYYLFVGLGFLANGIIDIFHAIIAYGLVIVPYSSQDVFIPGTWTAGRILMGICFLAVLFTSDRESDPGEITANIYAWSSLAAITALIVTAMFVLFEMPALILPGIPVFHRPWELLPALLFIVVLPKFYRLTAEDKDPFKALVAVSTAAGIFVQFYMTGSGPIILTPEGEQMFDPLFVLAHLVKFASYAILLTAVFVSTERISGKKIALAALSAGATVAIAAMLPVGGGEREAAVTEKPALRIGHLPITHAMLPMIVHARGTLTKSRLELVEYTSWDAMEEDIKNGRIDGGGSILNTLAIKIRADGLPFHPVLLAVRDGSVLIVGSDIRNAADLKGKRIAVPAIYSPHYLLLYKYLVDHDLIPNIDVDIPMIHPPDMVRSLTAGEINGFIVAEPFGAVAEELGIGKPLALSKDISIPGSTSNECTISLRADFITRYPDAVQEFVEQLILAGIWADEHPEEAAAIVASYLNQKEEIILKSLKEPEGRTSYLNLYPSENEFAAYQTYAIKAGLIDADRRIDINEFIDERFAMRAYQKLRAGLISDFGLKIEN